MKTLAILFLLFAGFASAQSACIVKNAYSADLTKTPREWHDVYLPGVLKRESGYLINEGPLQIDTNHRESALVTFPFVIYACKDHGIGFKPDLRSGSVIVKMDLKSNAVKNLSKPLQQTNFALWVQFELKPSSSDPTVSKPEPRYADYYFDSTKIDVSSGSPTVIRLDSDLNHWTCLGRDQLDMRTGQESGVYISSASKYTCALNHREFSEALESRVIDMGIVAILPELNEKGVPWRAAGQPTSDVGRFLTLLDTTLTLREFSIHKP